MKTRTGPLEREPQIGVSRAWPGAVESEDSVRLRGPVARPGERGSRALAERREGRLVGEVERDAARNGAPYIDEDLRPVAVPGEHRRQCGQDGRAFRRRP